MLSLLSQATYVQFSLRIPFLLCTAQRSSRVLSLGFSQVFYEHASCCGHVCCTPDSLVYEVVLQELYSPKIFTLSLLFLRSFHLSAAFPTLHTLPERQLCILCLEVLLTYTSAFAKDAVPAWGRWDKAKLLHWSLWKPQVWSKFVTSFWEKDPLLPSGTS